MEIFTFSYQLYWVTQTISTSLNLLLIILLLLLSPLLFLRKKKSPSQLRRQGRRRQEALVRAEEASSPINVEEAAFTVNVEGAEKDASDHEHSEVAEKAVQDLSDSGKVDTIKCTDTIDTAAAGTSVASCIQFKCDQGSYESASDKGVRQHIRMKHKISQLDGQDDCKINSSYSENNPCPLPRLW